MAAQYWADRDTCSTAAPLPKSSLHKKRIRRRSLRITRTKITLAISKKNKKKPSRMKKYCHLSPMMMMFCSKWIWTLTKQLAQTSNKTSSWWRVKMQLNLSKWESMSVDKTSFFFAIFCLHPVYCRQQPKQQEQTNFDDLAKTDFKDNHDTKSLGGLPPIQNSNIIETTDIRRSSHLT